MKRLKAKSYRAYKSARRRTQHPGVPRDVRSALKRMGLTYKTPTVDAIVIYEGERCLCSMRNQKAFQWVMNRLKTHAWNP